MVLCNCNQVDSIEFLKEVARLTGGRCGGVGEGAVCVGGVVQL